MPDYPGSCHCSAIGFRYRTSIALCDWSIRACQCSFCRAHDALSTSDPGGEIQFTARPQSRLQRYRFGLKTADFLLCRKCGVYIGAIIETPQGCFGIINIHALIDVPDDIAQASPTDYEGENTGGRVARREERWTPAVLGR